MVAPGPLALLGGGEFSPACAALDRDLLAEVGAEEVLVLATAAAFEGADAVVEHAVAYFAGLGVSAAGLPVLHRRDTDDPARLERVRSARALFITDGSPLHLRSVLKGSALYAAIVHAYEQGAALFASGAGATLLGDPMVDPRGGAYTVGLGLAPGLAVFPYHGTIADHLRERSVDLLPKHAVLAGIDAETALVKRGGEWSVAGPGAVVIYRRGAVPERLVAGDLVDLTA